MTISKSAEVAEDGSGPTDADVAKFELNKEELIAKSQKTVRDFMERYLNVLFIASVPFMAFLCWGFYRRKGYNLAEHFVINCFMASVANSIIIVFTLLAVLWEPMSPIGMLIAMIYYLYAMMSIYKNLSFWGFIQTGLFLSVYAAVIGAISLVAMLAVLNHYGKELGIPIMN